MGTRREQRRRSERGQGLTELAILMPFTLLLLLAVAELGRVQLWRLDLTAAAHSAVLYASQSTADAQNTEGIKARALADLGSLAPGSSTSDGAAVPTVSVLLGTAAGDGFGKQQVTVTVDLTVPALFRIPGFPSTYQLKAAAAARVLDPERRA
jgi:Flp pilus assembly protein TadG